MVVDNLFDWYYLGISYVFVSCLGFFLLEDLLFLNDQMVMLGEYGYVILGFFVKLEDEKIVLVEENFYGMQFIKVYLNIFLNLWIFIGGI